MSDLRTALDELKSRDVRHAWDEELGDDLVEIERAASALEVERARRVAELEERGVALRQGHSLTSWLADRLRLAPSWAARYVHWARALARMPRTRRAMEEGEIHASAAAVLVEAAGSAPEAFARDEQVLVEAAGKLPVRDLRRVVAYWLQAADPDGAEDESEARFGRRRLHVSPTLDGMVRVDGDLDPETGQVVVTALDAVLDAEFRSGPAAWDVRSGAQRRADALGEICRRFLDSADRPVVAGERPHVVVTVDLEALHGRAGRRCELGEAVPITPGIARRWACDADVVRIVTLGRSEPLDVGRRTPVVPPAIRRALVVRDGGCRYPGCGRPHPWCDAHHVRHWADDGPTALANLVLLCRRHHRFVHAGLGYRLALAAGSPRFLDGDGTPLEAGARGP